MVYTGQSASPYFLLAAELLFDIKPVYHFKDIGILDLRVCYNREWFVTE
ncbi:MAG: YlaC family protein [Candidatus Phlomobacter fragariae]